MPVGRKGYPCYEFNKSLTAVFDRLVCEQQHQFGHPPATLRPLANVWKLGMQDVTHQAEGKASGPGLPPPPSGPGLLQSAPSCPCQSPVVYSHGAYRYGADAVILDQRVLCMYNNT